MNHEAGRESKVVLRSAGEASLHVIDLKSPACDVPKPIVDAAAQSVPERCVGTGEVAGAAAGMRGSEQGVGKGTEPANRKRDSGSKQEVIFVDVDATLRAVFAAQVRHYTDERENFSLKRSIPPVKIAAGSSGAGAKVRISEENIPAGRNLSMGRNREQANYQSNSCIS